MLIYVFNLHVEYFWLKEFCLEKLNDSNVSNVKELYFGMKFCWQSFISAQLELEPLRFKF